MIRTNFASGVLFRNIAVLALFAMSSWAADSMSVITSSGAQGSNDSVLWSQLGADGTVLGSSFNVGTVTGATVQAALTAPNSVTSVVCSASPCSWKGAGFPSGDTLLWTSDAGNGGTGPLTLTLGSGIAGVGALVQADGPGPFTARIEAFNGATSLGAFTVSSNVNGDATYIGIKDLTAPNITSVMFSLTVATGNLGDFAIDTLRLNKLPAGPAISLSQSSLNFGNQSVGVPSAPQTITLTSAGTAALNISNIAASGDFSEITNCGSSLPANNSCSILIAFTPSVTGLRSGSVSITDNAGGSPHLVSLTGVGAVPLLTINSAHAGNFKQGQAGASYTLTVTNSGSGSSAGMVTVTETIPAGLALMSMAGPGWSCPGTASNNCNRSDALAGGSSYPPITVLANVAANASSPQLNAASVAGGGSGNASATDATVVTAVGTISLPSNVTVPPGNVFVAFPVTLSAPAQDLVFISLTSSDPSKVALSQGGSGVLTVSIQPGQTAPSSSVKVFGVDFGSATITASALGYSSVSQTVQVRGTAAFIPNPVTVNPGSNKKVTLALSGASPSGVTLNLSADNPAIASLPPTVAFGPGVTSVVLTVNGSAQGSTLIHASALPFIPDATVTIIVGNPGPPVITTSSLPNGQVGLPYSATLSATGGIVPLKWTLIGGQLPTGLSLDPSGVISGTPSVTATNIPLTFQVADATSPTPQIATATLILTVNFQGALTITSSSLPNGTLGTAYNVPLTSAGGTGPFTWTLAPGNTLPAGLSLSTGGVISGTPTATVTNQQITFKVTDSTTPIAQVATKTLSLTITSAALTLVTSSLPDGITNQSYSQLLQATGGTLPYTWSVIGSRLPTNYFLNASTGMITSDTGTCCIGSFQATIQVADSAGHSTSKILVINITDGSLQLITTSLPSGQVGVPYSATVVAKNGTPPYTWTMQGLLPTGLTLNSATGVISGTPTAPGNPHLRFIVTDVSSPQQTQSVFLNLLVNNGPPVISTTSLPNGTVNSAYSTAVVAAGGTTPYTWTATGLPNGLSINASTGVISGTPTVAGTSTAAITVKDSSSPQLSATANLPITIAPGGLGITTATLPVGAVNGFYSAPVTAAGGTPAYTWTATGLPVGLSINALTGVISGTPTTAGTSTAAITVKDSSSPQLTATANLPITINTALAISTTTLPGGSLNTAYSAPVVATGGTPAVTWTATGLPVGLSINASTGVISGTPTTAGTSTAAITAKDSSIPQATATANLIIGIAPAPLSITTTTLPNGTANNSYSATVAATGGTLPVTWAATGLPTGLSINTSSGVISGTPTTAGTSTVVVTATDSTNPTHQTANATFSLVIAPKLTILTTKLAPGVVILPYASALVVTGGVAPYHFSMTGQPSNLGLSNAGDFTGTSSTTGTFPVVITVTDSSSPAQQASGNFTITINSGLTITRGELPSGQVGKVYTTVMTYQGGPAPVVWSATNLPSGLSINPEYGTISGVPLVAGTTQTTVMVVDGTNHVATTVFPIVINP